MTDLERARKFFADDRYATEATGIIIEEASDNFARCSLEIGERHKNAVGNVMGGVMFTLADFVFAVSTNLNGPLTVTIASNISYLGSPKGNKLIGESRLIKDGKTTCFYEINITDDIGTAVAVVAITGMHIHK